MKIGDKLKYETSKNSLKIYYGFIIGFKQDKINVSKHKYSDFSGQLLPTWIDKENIIK